MALETKRTRIASAVVAVFSLLQVGKMLPVVLQCLELLHASEIVQALAGDENLMK